MTKSVFNVGDLVEYTTGMTESLEGHRGIVIGMTNYNNIRVLWKTGPSWYKGREYGVYGHSLKKVCSDYKIDQEPLDDEETL